MKKIFFSYSHADEGVRDKLDKHFSLLKRNGLIDSWYDRDIEAGQDIDDMIKARLEESDIIIFLVSNDFIASDYCYNNEMKKAMTLHEAGKAIVVPVIARACDWKATPFGGLMACPTDAQAISKWEDEDDALFDVVESIKKIIV